MLTEGLAVGATSRDFGSGHDRDRPVGKPRIALLHYTAPPTVGRFLGVSVERMFEL